MTTETTRHARNIAGRIEAFFPKFNVNLCVFIVVACCAVLAVQLGIFEPTLRFEKVSQNTLFIHEGNEVHGNFEAFAYKNSILLGVPEGENSSVSAMILGRGGANSVELSLSTERNAISSLKVNGETACAPCNSSKKYALAKGTFGDLKFEMKSGSKNEGVGNASGFVGPFITPFRKDYLYAHLFVTVGGGWKANENAEMPSSFYGTDAPRYIRITQTVGESLENGEFLWPTYKFFTCLPPAFLYLSGFQRQYAYKIYVILLFFVPIVIFYLFSRKLTFAKNASFLFASLCYLFYPILGMPMGGSNDLFVLGMTSQALATYLSLLFFYFAYELVLEKKNAALAPAVLFFALSVFCNARILFPLGIGIGILFAFSLLHNRIRGLFFLSLLCAVVVAWFLFAMFYNASLSDIGTLGGVQITKLEDAASGMFYYGWFILPLLVIAGTWRAFKEKESVLLFLVAVSLAAYVCATNPALNEHFHFIDGLRALPSVFLPLFLVAGAGAAALFMAACAKAEKIRKNAQMDRITFAGVVVLAVLIPSAAIFTACVKASFDGYPSAADALLQISEYESLESAYLAIGNAPVFFVTTADVSQYPIFEANLYSVGNAPFMNSSNAASTMQNAGVCYLLLGNSERFEGVTAGNGAKESYWSLKNSCDFSEIGNAGSYRLFKLEKCDANNETDVFGAIIAAKKKGEGYVEFSGYCSSGNCSVRINSIFTDGYFHMAREIGCKNRQGSCSVRRDGANAIIVENIGAGEFNIVLTPKQDALFAPIFAFCALAAVALVYLSTTKLFGKLI